eukprot:6468631-Amphidinium_carterae.1
MLKIDFGGEAFLGVSTLLSRARGKHREFSLQVLRPRHLSTSPRMVARACGCFCTQGCAHEPTTVSCKSERRTCQEAMKLQHCAPPPRLATKAISRKSLAQNDQLFITGEVAHFMYFVRSGRLRCCGCILGIMLVR